MCSFRPSPGIYSSSRPRDQSGTYNYPIIFTIPADSPPSLECPFGSVIWTLTATIHRPGRFNPKMKAVRKINVVATPNEDSTETAAALTIDKTWKDQLRYCLTISGGAFPIGSNIQIRLVLEPITKVKIHRVSIAIDGTSLYFPNKTYLLTIASPPFNRRCYLLPWNAQGREGTDLTRPLLFEVFRQAHSNTPSFRREP